MIDDYKMNGIPESGIPLVGAAALLWFPTNVLGF